MLLCEVLPTQQVCRDGSFQVDVFGSIVVVEFAADVGMQVLVERLYGLEDLFQVLLKCVCLVCGAPGITFIFKTWMKTWRTLLLS